MSATEIKTNDQLREDIKRRLKNVISDKNLLDVKVKKIMYVIREHHRTALLAHISKNTKLTTQCRCAVVDIINDYFFNVG